MTLPEVATDPAARVAHAVVYIAGIPWVRTGAFAVSVVGLLMILAELL